MGARPNGPLGAAVCGGLTLYQAFANGTEDMLIIKKEKFGAAVPILNCDAVARANGPDVGPSGSVWSNDIAAAERLECGTAWIDRHSGLGRIAPYGRVKCSGFGTEFNIERLKEHAAIQVLNIASG